LFSILQNRTATLNFECVSMFCVCIIGLHGARHRDALQTLQRRRFDSLSPASVVGTFGVTSNSLSGTSTLSASYCTAASTVAVKLLVLTTLWLVTIYTLCRGAASISSVVDVPAVFMTNVNIVYVMSWVLLQRQFVSARVCHNHFITIHRLPHFRHS